jgi:hypothetical protein
MSNYYLTSGNNLELYFHYPKGSQESGTLYVYGYNNARMEDFPFTNIKIENFDLKQCHPSVYGSYCLKTGINYSGNSWWFAWVDTDSNDDSDFLKGRKGFTGINVNLSDPAGMAYGQMGNTGININPSSVNKIFFSLQEVSQGFPQIGWKKFSYNHDIYFISIRRVTSEGQPVIFSKYLRRNFICAQDFILSSPYTFFKEGGYGVGLRRDGSLIPGYEILIRAHNNIVHTFLDNGGQSNPVIAGYSTFTGRALVSDGYRVNDPTYSPIKPPAHPTGWKNLGEN